MYPFIRLAALAFGAWLCAAGETQAQTFRDEGDAAYRAGDFTRAVELYEKSLTTALKVMKEEDIEVIERRGDLGDSYLAVDRLDDARMQFDYIWKRMRYDAEQKQRWAAKEGTLALGYAEKLGRLYQGAGRYDDALLVFATALHDAERTQHEEDALQFTALLAETQFVAGKNVDAATTAARAFGLAANAGKNPSLQGRALSQLSLMCLRHKQIGLAKPMAQRALELARHALAIEPSKGIDAVVAEATRTRLTVTIADYQARLAGVLVQTGALEEADALLGTARETILETETPQSAHLVEVLLTAADLTLKENQPGDALKRAQEALAICRVKFPALHPDTGRALQKAGDCQLALKKPHLAKPLYQEAVVMLEKTLGNDDPLTTATRDQLAKLGTKLVIPATSSAAPGPGK